jgi:hypothetical protein
MRYLYSGVARDGNGVVIASATIDVFLAGGVTPATVYSSQTSTVGVNRIISDTYGYFKIYTDAFDYNSDKTFLLRVGGPTNSSRDYDNVVINDIVLGTYDITSDKTVTTSLDVPNGVIYRVTNSTLTINGSFQSGSYHIFTCVGSGKVVFGSGVVVESYPEWFGAVGNGTTDDSTAILLAATSFGLHGGTVIVRGKYLIDKDLTIPENITIKGDASFVGSYDAVNYNSLDALIVNSSFTITILSGSGIDGCLIKRKGIVFPTTDTSAFAGTAITAGGDDNFVFNTMILGFNKAYYSYYKQRARIDKVQGDNTNGIEILHCMDIARISDVHMWPFSIYPNPGSYVGRGTAYKFTDVGDWNKITNSFSYGYSIGFDIENVSNVTMLGCGADSAATNNEIGFYIHGGSRMIRLIGCQAAGQEDCGYKIDIGTANSITLSNCDAWGTSAHGIYISSGNVYINGGILEAATNGITVNSSSSKVLYDGITNLCSTAVNNVLASPYIVSGFYNYGAGWVGPSGGGGGTPGGSTTQIQFNDGGTFGADSSFTYNKTSKLLSIDNIATHGFSATASGVGTGTSVLAYLNVPTGYTGKIIKALYNSIEAFSVDYAGVLETTNAVVLANNKPLMGRKAGGTSRDLIYMGSDDHIKIGTASSGDPIEILPFSSQTGILQVTNGLLSVTTGGGGMVYPGAGVAFSSGSAWGTSKAIGSDIQAYSSQLNTIAGLTPTNGYVIVGNGTTWTVAAQSGGSGSPGGSTTNVQYNNAGSFAGDTDFTWDAGNNLLTALNIATTGLSVTGAAGTSGNAAYINGASTFTGNLIAGASNSVAKFSIDYTGKFSLTDNIVMENNKTITAKDTGATLRNLISIGADNKIYIGSSNGSSNYVMIGSGTNITNPVYMRIGGADVQVTNLIQTYPGAGIVVSTGSGWTTSVSNNSANWNTAYNECHQWDGGSTNLVAATGRTSLGLGTVATYSYGDFATSTQGSHADTAYGWGNWASYIGSSIQAYNSNLTGINQGLTTSSTPTFAGLNSSASMTLNNNTAYFCKDSGGTGRVMIGLGSDDNLAIGTSVPGSVNIGYNSGVSSPILIRTDGVNSRVITAGAADSGGTGYRVLRVPN